MSTYNLYLANPPLYGLRMGVKILIGLICCSWMAFTGFFFILSSKADLMTDHILSFQIWGMITLGLSAATGVILPYCQSMRSLTLFNLTLMGRGLYYSMIYNWWLLWGISLGNILTTNQTLSMVFLAWIIITGIWTLFAGVCLFTRSLRYSSLHIEPVNDYICYI